MGGLIGTFVVDVPFLRESFKERIDYYNDKAIDSRMDWVSNETMILFSIAFNILKHPCLTAPLGFLPTAGIRISIEILGDRNSIVVIVWIVKLFPIEFQIGDDNKI